MNLSQVRQEATRRLRSDGHGFSKLILLHTAVTTGISLLLLLINWLSQYIAPEGGLRNLDTQIMLSTVRTLLQLFSIILVPFWDAGLIFCALRLVQGQRSTPGTLTEGFRRWGAIASSLGIRILIYFLAAVACSFASSMFLSLLPLPESMYQELIAFTETPSFPLNNGLKFMFVLYLMIYTAGLCVLLIPILYLHRQVVYQVMDDESCTGFQAVLQSRILMKGNRWKLFLLDLSFWWFYLLDMVISVLSLGHLILSGLGITLPVGPDAAGWIFSIAALLLRLVLYWFAKPKLAVSYALFYQKTTDKSLKEPEPPQPKRMPWKY